MGHLCCCCFGIASSDLCLLTHAAVTAAEPQPATNGCYVGQLCCVAGVFIPYSGHLCTRVQHPWLAAGVLHDDQLLRLCR
jgi:hypothetical protein